MQCTKTATPKKIEANRKNSQRATGPRTNQGKRNSRFNAVTLGLFAKHVAIPICDGYKPETDFQALLDNLHQDFQPAGVYEEWLVVKIAECMWRLRRATRCESGSVQEAAIWDSGRPENKPLVQELASEICALSEAERQLRKSGTLSQKSYREVTPLLEEEERKTVESEKDNEPLKAEIDHERFLTYIRDRRGSLDSMYKSLISIEGDRFDARFDHDSLPPEEDMDRILRYEERMHRQIDWAVQRLLDSQERRTTLHSSPEALG